MLESLASLYQDLLVFCFVLDKEAMEEVETNSNIEAINAAIAKIKYYSCLPAHIKGGIAALDDLNSKESVDNGLNSPAHVVGGSVTAIGGRINIPDIHEITRLYKIDESPPLLFN